MGSAAVNVSGMMALNGNGVLNGDGETCYKCSRRRAFERVDSMYVSDLIPILKDRLPLSANLYNMVKMHSKWSKEVSLYVFGGEITSDAWIVAAFQRGDGFGMEICVSRPPNSRTTYEIKEAFSKSNFIDWSEPFVFESVDTEIGTMVSEISVREKGNCTNVHPCNMYTMDVEDAIHLSDKRIYEDNVEVKPIDTADGAKFIIDTWKYASEGSDRYVRKVLSKNLSAGVYVDGKIVAGVVFAVHGLTSMLYTLKEHRGKGYARLAMHFLMKRLADEGLVPGAVVDLRNEASKAFQKKIGFKLAGSVDYIVFEKLEF